MEVCIILEIFFRAILSTVGAFVPIFILMIIHFFIRKSNYIKIRRLLVKEKDARELIVSLLINKEQIDQKIKELEKINDVTLDILYIDSYSLKTYLSNLLDKRFPDKYFNR